MRRRSLVGALVLLGLGGGGYVGKDQILDRRTAPTVRSTPAPTPTETGTPSSTPQPTATPMPAVDYAETITYGGKRLTVADPRTSRELEFDEGSRTAAEGSVFLTLHLTTRNVGDQSLNIPWPFVVRHGDGEFSVRGQFKRDSPEQLLSPERRLYGPSTVYWPDATHEGWVYAEIPADASEVTFVWSYDSAVRDDPDDELTYRVPVPGPE
ncbi:hypothetical protein [Halobaculum rarum]|uniref:hypothetical protein n=1 Tax=Halobaculum rarum TaxID=3075122 RepID=UPI0032AE95D4